MEELEKRKIQDALRHKINHRPLPSELIDHNILKGMSYYAVDNMVIY